jgi:hypothetical protein
LIPHQATSPIQGAKISVEMRISIALLRFFLLTHALATTTTQTNVSPVFDGFVDHKTIETREPTVLQVNSTDLALEEHGDDGGVVEPRQIEALLIMGLAVASLILAALIESLVFHIEEDNPVGSNSMLLLLLVLTMIRHSFVRNTLSRRSPTCMLITPMPTMLYATWTLISRSMGTRAQVGIICTTSFRCP